MIWVDINLLWDFNYCENKNLPTWDFNYCENKNLPIAPDLSEREKEVFGITLNEAYDVLKVEDLNKLRNWIAIQPETIEFWVKTNQLRVETKQKSFCGLELNKPGTMIETEDGKHHLLGSINTEAGVCGDCSEFHSSVIVKRYAVVFDFSQFEEE